MEVNIFKCYSYKEFLAQMFDSDSAEKGQRSLLAKYLGCQTGLVSQVMNSDRHFSMEQIVEIAEYFQLKDEEKEFLVLLAQFERAGSEKLRQYYLVMLERIRLGRQRVIGALGRDLTEGDFGLYHSKWYNHALHVLMELHPKADVAELARTLGITTVKVEESLGFLISVGALKLEEGRYQVCEINNSAKRGSPWVDGIHQDFRLEAIKSLDRRTLADSHYSRFFLASERKSALLQEELAEFMKRVNELIARPEEKNDVRKLHALCLDSFTYDPDSAQV